MWLINTLNTALDHIDEFKAYLLTVDFDRVIGAIVLAFLLAAGFKWIIEAVLSLYIEE